MPVALASPLLGDADCNGVVNAADTTAVIRATFEGSTCPAADVNNDGRRGAADLSAELLVLARALTDTVTPTPSATATPTRTPGMTRFGVIASGDQAARPEIVNDLSDLGATWVRVNVNLDGTIANDPNLFLFLNAGLNVVVTLVNRNPANVDTTYGTLAEWVNAGFPFASQQCYERDVQDTLRPWLAALNADRIWVQCENEVGDAAVSSQARFWRGTTVQYLRQLDALFAAVRGLSAAAPVVLTSFASENLDAAIDPTDPRHDYQVSRMTQLLSAASYTAADLHVYGCVDDIRAKAQWVKDHLPPGRQWISTENGGPDFRCPATPISWMQNPSLFEQIEAQQVPARLSACADAGGDICLWFSLLDLKSESDVFNHLGLLDSYIDPPRRKPAYAAFQLFVATHQ